MQEETASYYKRKVNEVLGYIGNNLDKDLSIKKLADYSAISQYHFHRIMTAALNEPLGSYINRLRLEAAVTLLRYSNEPLNEIAFSIGYADLSAFSKAFSKEFGLSPSEYKNDASIVLNTHIDYQAKKSEIIISDPKPKIIRVPERRVVYIQVRGKYGGPETLQAWDELGNYAIKFKLAGWNPELFTIYYDDPNVVGYENCISDLCISLKKEANPHKRIKTKTIPGGKYAVFRYRGPYDHLWELYDHIYRYWVLTTDMKLKESPSFEKYLNYSDRTKPEKLLTEIYLPIE